LLDKAKEIFHGVIINPVKKNLAAVFFWGGIVMVLVGAALGGAVDKLPFIPLGTGEALLKVGSAILGAGVFAIIMKSSQFVKIFQDHIFDVFYRPETAISGIALKDKWRDITNSMLKEVLPKTHLEASDKIEQQFFDAELMYHFEEYYNSYTITIDKAKNIATIELFSKSTIILSPNSPNPILKQSIETGGEIELKALRINDADVLSDNPFKKDKEDDNKHIHIIPLNKYTEKKEDGVMVARLEKVTKWSQNLSVDPYVKANISRYIKGATIRVKLSNGFKVFFERFGLGNLPKNHYLRDDGEGYERWVLVEPNDLLLPGQGYILMVVPERK